ncbi:MAG: Bacitracin transport permease protein BCRC [Parcubacteria group bacterium GW2011_GWB1_36_5]|nr:MAG: Bacitracin transport permease protein BCRC [Parcubacteria group bacterium GW2011_GWB1_36_5]KKR15482.1 MAG: Bacitracin transport permease protein BCRC [Candidatus Daviesbacteria bacterium GW2011_GWA2_39_33]
MNNQIFFFFYNLAHQSAFFDNLVIFFAVYFPFIVIFLAGIFLLMHHEIFKAESIFQILMQKKKELLLAFLSSFLAYFLAVILKLLFHTSRPFLDLPNVQALFSETGFAFPSGHAAFFGALGVALFLTHKKAGYIFMFFAFIIGFSRVIAGIHFPIDILGGFVLGVIVAYFLKKI